MGSMVGISAMTPSRIARAIVHFAAMLFAVVLIRALVVFYEQIWSLGR